jgi:putative redox protein
MNFERTSFRVQFPGGNGFVLAGIVDQPQEPAAGSPVAVFSHCFTCNKDLKVIARVSRGLAQHGVVVLRYDMTGLGGSEGDFSRTSFSTNLRDLSAAIAYAESTLGQVVSLLGHSFGGAVSLAIAGNKDLVPESLRSLITLAAPADTIHLARLLDKMNPEIESTGEGEVVIGGLRWNIFREMLDDFRQFNLPKQISRINVPTLVCHVQNDPMVGYDAALRIMGLMQNGREDDPPVSLLTIPGNDHLLSQSSADIELITSIAAAFIRRHARTN